jgi:hypothetical protein
MRPVDGQYYCALRLQWLLVTPVGNEFSEVDVIAFKVEAKSYSSGLRFRAPDGGSCWGIVLEDSPKEHGLLLV